MAESNDTSRILGQLQAGVEGLETSVAQFRMEYREDFAKFVAEVRDQRHRHNNEVQDSYGHLERRVRDVENKMAQSEGASKTSNSWLGSIVAFGSALLAGFATYVADHWK